MLKTREQWMRECPHAVQVSHDPESLVWLLDEGPASGDWNYYPDLPTKTATVVFRHHRDAVMFKLMWGGS